MSGRFPLILDHHRNPGGNGLSIQCAPEVVCYRHNSIQPCAKGIWEVDYAPSLATCEFTGAENRSQQRPAVVDDFGSLVFVGEPQ